MPCGGSETERKRLDSHPEDGHERRLEVLAEHFDFQPAVLQFETICLPFKGPIFNWNTLQIMCNNNMSTRSITGK